MKPDDALRIRLHQDWTIIGVHGYFNSAEAWRGADRDDVVIRGVQQGVRDGAVVPRDPDLPPAARPQASHRTRRPGWRQAGQKAG